MTALLIIYYIMSMCGDNVNGYLQTAILQQSNDGEWGKWGNDIYCQSGDFAIGFKIKVESPQQPNDEAKDDTSANAIQLLCASLTDTAPYAIKSEFENDENYGNWGNWSSDIICPSNSFIFGFDQKVQRDQGKGDPKKMNDDTTLNSIKMKCVSADGGSNETIIEPNNGGEMGDYTNIYQNCPPNSYVCGFNQKVEGEQGGSDDTALNAVELFCCSYSCSASNITSNIKYFGIVTSYVKNSETNGEVTLILWFDNVMYECNVHPLNVSHAYGCDSSSWTVLLNDTNSSAYKIMIQSHNRNAVVIDEVIVNFTDDSFYGINAWCINRNDIYINESSGYLQPWMTNDNVCGSRQVHSEHLCVDNEENDCGPDKQIVHFDCGKKNEFITNSVWADGTNSLWTVNSAKRNISFGIHVSDDVDAESPETLSMTLYWDKKIFECDVTPSNNNHWYMCDNYTDITLPLLSTYNISTYKLNLRKKDGQVNGVWIDAVIVIDEDFNTLTVSTFCSSLAFPEVNEIDNCSNVDGETLIKWSGICLDQDIQCNSYTSLSIYFDPAFLDNSSYVTRGTDIIFISTNFTVLVNVSNCSKIQVCEEHFGDSNATKNSLIIMDDKISLLLTNYVQSIVGISDIIMSPKTTLKTGLNKLNCLSNYSKIDFNIIFTINILTNDVISLFDENGLFMENVIKIITEQIICLPTIPNSDTIIVLYEIIGAALGFVILMTILFLIYWCQKKKNIENLTIYIKTPMVIVIAIGEYLKDPICPDINGDVSDLLDIDKDIKTLKQLCKHFNYSLFPKYKHDTYCKIYWEEREIMQFLKNKAQQLNNRRLNNKQLYYDGLLVIISCHGIKDHIITSDIKIIEKTVIHRIFSTKYPDVRKLPRIFVYDSCCGAYERVSVSDSDSDNGKHANIQSEQTKQVGVKEVNDATMWNVDAPNPDFQLVTIHAANPDFQSKMSCATGSYVVQQFAKRLMDNTKNKLFLFEIFDAIQYDLRTKQQTVNTYSNGTRYIKFVANSDTGHEGTNGDRTGECENKTQNVDENGKDTDCNGDSYIQLEMANQKNKMKYGKESSLQLEQTELQTKSVVYTSEDSDTNKNALIFTKSTPL